MIYLSMMISAIEVKSGEVRMSGGGNRAESRLLQSCTKKMYCFLLFFINIFE